jgi:hypothetical protein
MSWRDILKQDFLQIAEAVKEAQKRAKETGKTQYVIAESDYGAPAEYTIHTEDISFKSPNLVLYEKVEP